MNPSQFIVFHLFYKVIHVTNQIKYCPASSVTDHTLVLKMIQVYTIQMDWLSKILLDKQLSNHKIVIMFMDILYFRS